MAVLFDFALSFTPVNARTPRVLSARFGDGYEQRSEDGIHADLQSWRVSFDPILTSEADAIEAFLVQNQCATIPFNWTPPRGPLDVFATGWRSGVSPADNDWIAMVWGGTQYVAVSNTGSGNRVMTSPDGVTWTLQSTVGKDNAWAGLAWNGTIFVAVALSGTGNRVMTSPDGVTWTLRTSAADNNWLSVAWNGTVWAAVSITGTLNRAMTSPDGITWTIRVTPAGDYSWRNVVWNGTLFVAVANSGTGNRVMTSPDGITWTLRTTPVDLNWTAVAVGGPSGTRTVAIANTGTNNQVMTSEDGITWTTRTTPSPSQLWFALAWNGTVFAALAQSLTETSVMTSPDGITWTLGVLPSTAYLSWRCLASNGSQFAGAALTGTGNRTIYTVTAIGKYLCRSWNRTVRGFTVEAITATFEEVADP